LLLLSTDTWCEEQRNHKFLAHTTPTVGFEERAWSSSVALATQHQKRINRKADLFRYNLVALKQGYGR
jgi:hypothetical protein